MITKEQLQAMSDFEVNKALAELIYRSVHSVSQNSSAQDAVVFADKGAGDIVAVAIVGYCNNPSDIMPLAFEHGVSLIKMLSDWRACTNNGIYVENSFDDKTPLRAIACCLILVLQEKQN